MNDLEILKQLHDELESVDPPHFTENMIGFYRLLVSRVPEDGFEQILDDNEVSLEHEAAILQLQKYGYLERTMNGIGRGRIEHTIDLRGKRFSSLPTPNQSRTATAKSSKPQNIIHRRRGDVKDRILCVTPASVKPSRPGPSATPPRENRVPIFSRPLQWSESGSYVGLRLDELKWATIVHELGQKDREEQKEIRDRMREEAKA